MTSFSIDQNHTLDTAFAHYDRERVASDEQLAVDNARADAIPQNGFTESLRMRQGARAGAAIQHGLRNGGLALDLLFALRDGGLITINFEDED